MNMEEQEVEKIKKKQIPPTKKAKPKQFDENGKQIKEKRLSDYQWGEILSQLSSGIKTQNQLADEYGITAHAIYLKRQRMGGIKIGDKSIKNSIKRDVVRKNKQDKETVSELKKIKGFSLQEASDLIVTAKKYAFDRSNELQQVARHLIQEGLKNGNLGAQKDAMKVILDAQTIFQNGLNNSGICLGFKNGEYDSVEDLPVLNIRKMTKEDIDELQEKMRDDLDEDGVAIESEPESDKEIDG